ncbi:hypothetical protein L1887_15123 [Cichorium endivia]|nr:hypothetical protein L1887_15123 [Cichorium endivia]
MKNSLLTSTAAPILEHLTSLQKQQHSLQNPLFSLSSVLILCKNKKIIQSSKLRWKKKLEVGGEVGKLKPIDF